MPKLLACHPHWLDSETRVYTGDYIDVDEAKALELLRLQVGTKRVFQRVKVEVAHTVPLTQSATLEANTVFITDPTITEAQASEEAELLLAKAYQEAQAAEAAQKAEEEARLKAEADRQAAEQAEREAADKAAYEKAQAEEAEARAKAEADAAAAEKGKSNKNK